MLGGNVTAQLVGSTLLLTGDALDNALVVSTATGGRMAVLGGLGTTINGSTSPFVTSWAVTSIVANLSAGNDIIGSVSVVGGDQRDGIRITGTSVNGVVAAALGNGENVTIIDSYGSKVGSFAYTRGTGDDFVRVTATPLTIRNGVNVYTGPRGEDDVDVSATSIGGSLVVNSGDGGDYLDAYGDTVGGGVAINAGAGDDFIECEYAVGLNTVIDAGAGNDRVFSSGLTTRYNLCVYLGPGDDRLELYNSSAFAAFLYGGTGANTLTTNAATRTGIRTLKYFQFQTVNNT